MPRNSDKVGLSAPLVHSVLAAAMTDPSLLESWRHAPETLGRVGLRPDAIDLNRIWRFSGLVTKVRHNDVRLTFPLTFRLLDHADLSIALFAEYARVAAELRKTGVKSRDEKAHALYNFLEEWLDHRIRFHAFVWDLIRHEKTMNGLESTSAIPVDTAILGQTEGQKLSTKFTPVRASNLIVHDMGCNPVDLAEIVRTNIAVVRSLPYKKRLFAYCRTRDAAAIQVVEIDAITSVIIDLANGKRSITELATLVRQFGVAVDPRQLCKPVAQLVAKGMLYAS